MEEGKLEVISPLFWPSGFFYGKAGAELSDGMVAP